MVKPRLPAVLVIALLLLPHVASASWIRIADVNNIHKEYNTTAPLRARWWDIRKLPVDIDLPPTNAVYIELRAPLQCQNGIPPKYNVTFYVSFAGHNLTKTATGYDISGAKYKGWLLLNKTVDGKIHIDLETDARNCAPYLAFAMVVYTASIREEIDWNPPGNATITFHYQPPSPRPEKLDIDVVFKLDPASTSTTIAYQPVQVPLIPVTDSILDKLIEILHSFTEEAASSIINKTAILTHNETVAREARRISPGLLVASSLSPKEAGPNTITLYVPRGGNYTYVASMYVEEVLDLEGASYELLNNTVLLLRGLEATVKLSAIVKAPVSYHVYWPEDVVIPGKWLYLPAYTVYNVYTVDPIVDSTLPNATKVSWLGRNYSIGFNISWPYAVIMVNDDKVMEKILAVVQEVTVCYYMDHETCIREPLVTEYSPWGVIRITSYNETAMEMKYIVPPLYNRTIGNETVLGILGNDKLLVLVYGYMNPGVNLTGLLLNGTLEGVVVAVSHKPRAAEQYVKRIIFIRPGSSLEQPPSFPTLIEPRETKYGYLLAFNAYADAIVFSAAVDVHVRDADTGGPVAAEVLALQNGTVVDRAKGSDVTLKLFPGNYTLEVRLGSLAFYRNITVEDDMEVTIEVTLPRVTNVSVKAPRYSFGEAELRITVKLDKPAPADYNITGRIIVDDSWERGFTIPVRANSTEASTVVKLSLAEGKHNIKVVVGDVVAEVEVTVAGGSMGLMVAAVIGVAAIGVVLFLLRRPREIAF